jgi:hypothetical protein
VHIRLLNMVEKVFGDFVEATHVCSISTAENILVISDGFF